MSASAAVSRCAEINTDRRWLSEHLARPDVKQRLDEQEALRRRLGWDAATIKDPFTRGITQVKYGGS